MNFSEALTAVKAGKHIQRSGWNGKNMFVVYQPGYPNGVCINENTAKALNRPLGELVRFQPYLMMLTAQGDCVPWLASQSDLLSDDWSVS